MQRDAKYQRILTSSNPSNKPTYEIPNANKTNSIKSTVKDAECEIYRKKFKIDIEILVKRMKVQKIIIHDFNDG